MEYFAYLLLGLAVGQAQGGASIMRTRPGMWRDRIIAAVGLSAIAVPFSVFLTQSTPLALTFIFSAVVSWLVKISLVDRAAAQGAGEAS